MSPPAGPPGTHGTSRAIPVTQIPTNSRPLSLPETLSDGPHPADEVFELGRTGRVDAEMLETVLESLLARYPDAPIAASGADGVAVPMPDSIPLRDNPVLQSPSGLHLVVPGDRVRLLATWDRVLAGGAARCLAHLTGDPGTTVAYSGLDLRERHGVLLAVFTPVDAAEAFEAPDLEVREAERTLPRFSTMTKDERSFIIETDEALTQLLGWTAEEVQGHRSIEFLHPDDHALAVDNWMEMLASSGPGRRVRLRHRHRDGSWVWFEVTNHNLLNNVDRPCVVSELVDISEEMAAQDEIRAREQLLHTLAEAIPLGLFQVDASREIVYTNDRLHEILGVEQMTTVKAQLATVVEADRQELELALDEALASGAPADIEVELRLPLDRDLRYCTINLRGLKHDDGTVSGAIVCVADVTDSSRMRNELAKRATFDELTGCYNRPSIMLALEANIAEGEPQAERAVMFVDLDRFKQVNDQYGHAAGDELLRIVAERLQSVVRPGDLVGRIGGDEFLAVCPDIGGAQQAIRLARRLTSTLSGDVRLSAGTVSHHVSIGVAWSDSDDADADSLVALADSAMYESKRRRTGEPALAQLDPGVAA